MTENEKLRPQLYQNGSYEEMLVFESLTGEIKRDISFCFMPGEISPDNFTTIVFIDDIYRACRMRATVGLQEFKEYKGDFKIISDTECEIFERSLKVWDTFTQTWMKLFY